MQSFTLNAIPEIVFGAGKLSEIAAKATRLAGNGAHAVVVADPALRAPGITARCHSILAGA